MIRSNSCPARYGAFGAVVCREWLTVSRSYAILLVLIGGIFLYGMLYNLMYAPNLVREVPVLAVDRSCDAFSRDYLQRLDATSQVRIIGSAVDLREARRQMSRGEADAIVYLPADFRHRVMRDRQGVMILFANTSAFLNFEAVQSAAVGAMMAWNDRLRAATLRFVPKNEREALVEAPSPAVVGRALFNPTKGYGSYLLPPVLIIIMFQTMLMTMAVSCGGEIYRRTIVRYADRGDSLWRMMSVVMGRTVFYGGLYAVFALFLLGLLPLLFDLPVLGEAADVVALMIPFLLATSFFGQALTVFYSDGDAPLLMIAFFSVGLVFLSGISYPLELMPWYWRVAHLFFPAAPAALAFVQIHSMGASLSDVMGSWLTLWGQCVVYMFLACLAYRYNVRRTLRKISRDHNTTPQSSTTTDGKFNSDD